MKPRAVIFDVYGTLLQVGSAPPDAEAQWRRLHEESLGTPPPLGRLEFGRASAEIIQRRHAAARAQGIAYPEIHWPSIVAEILPGFRRLTPPQQADFLFRQIQTGHTVNLAPGAAEALFWLEAERIRLGIASNAQAYTLRELQEALVTAGLGLRSFEPELRFWSFEHGFSKPDPHVFRILTARLEARGLAPGETLMVGDHLENDIAPARLAGWQAWHLSLPGQLGDGGWGELLNRWQR